MDTFPFEVILWDNAYQGCETLTIKTLRACNLKNLQIFIEPKPTNEADLQIEKVHCALHSKAWYLKSNETIQFTMPQYSTYSAELKVWKRQNQIIGWSFPDIALSEKGIQIDFNAQSWENVPLFILNQQITIFWNEVKPIFSKNAKNQFYLYYQDNTNLLTINHLT